MSITMSYPTDEEVASSSSLEFPQPCRQFKISEILEATKNFDESLVVGRGGFGKVYKGTIIHVASVLDLAIKRMDSTSNQGAIEFWVEVKMLSKLRHCHLVSLIGYCNDEQEMIIVYEYMPHGTLEDHLHKRATSLPWLRRLKICVGAARGLDYLHTGTGIKHGVIHRDVKSSNILLDNSWASKVSDFGLSKICPTNQPSTSVSTLVKGTFGYLDPHYYSTGKLTRKSDVYAFGVVLLEVLCGKRAVDASLELGLAGWAQDSIKEGRLKQIVDSNLEGRASSKCLKGIARLANHCLHSNPNQRPSMAEVVVCLESVLAVQEKAKITFPHVGMTIFGRKVPMFLSRNSGKHFDPVLVRQIRSLDKYLYTVGGENRMLRRFDFDTLNVATESFSIANEIFRNNLRQMYKGRLQNGQKIAVVVELHVSQGCIINEVRVLVRLEHENLHSVLGYCIHETKVFIVYTFAPYATLQCLLDDKSCLLLDWNKRYKILLGVARILFYLHNHAPFRVAHCHLFPRNILLDESLDPTLFNFRFAKCFANEKHDCIMDAESRSMCLSKWGYMETKHDVFSFGLVVLETISGYMSCQNHQQTGESLDRHAWRKWFEGTSIMIDPRIGVDSSLMARFVDIGLLCIQPNVDNRPTMEKVIDMLLGSSSLTHLLSKNIRDDVVREFKWH